jgi:ATP adenylyltransferase
MEYLWTPWRMAYIAGADQTAPAPPTPPAGEPIRPEDAGQPAQPAESGSGCVFCDRVRLPPSHDRASLILHRAERNFVILNLYPYNSGHLMVVPYEHTADLTALDTATRDEMIALAQRMVVIIRDEYSPQGFNLGMNLGHVAGAGIADHLHMHVVPRWAGDTNFMPVVGQTKVLPELLETTYDRLKARLSRYSE